MGKYWVQADAVVGKKTLWIWRYTPTTLTQESLDDPLRR